MDKTQFDPQNPNALFSPDQWTNQFSNFNNKALPWPSTFYTGTPAGSMPPTDAMGRPIQSFLDMQAKHDAWQPPASSGSASTPMGTDPNFGLENQWLAANGQPVQLAPTQTPGQLGPQTQAALQAMMGGQGAAGGQGQNQPPPGLASPGAQTVPGTTLNSMPQTQTPAAGSAQPGQPGQGSTPQGYASQMPILQGAPAASNAAANSNPMLAQLAGWQALQDPRGAAGGNMFGDAYLNQISKGGGQQQGGGGSSTATNPFDMHQAYLDALANPGKVTTPGATVPASAASTQPGPGSLQAFLANWKPAQSGPGSGFQQGFGNALKGMGY